MVLGLKRRKNLEGFEGFHEDLSSKVFLLTVMNFVGVFT